MKLIAKNNKTNTEVELSTDWFFNDNYGYFILEDKEDWEFSIQKPACDHVFENINIGVMYYEKCKKCGHSLY